MDKKAVKELVKKIWRFPFTRIYRLKLKNKQFSLISANCIGGVLCHDLGQQFRSPTINLIIPEYLKFVCNLPHYLNVQMTSGGVDVHGWPVGIIDDIKILGVHYKSEQDLINSWERRRKRVNFDNIFLIATDEYIKTSEDIEQFGKLPYPKVLYKSTNDINYDFEVYIPGYIECKNVGDILKYDNIFGARKFEKYFDCVKWLNVNLPTSVKTN